MDNSTQIDAKTLKAALQALDETVTPVYAAYEEDGYIVIWFCNRTEPSRWKPPAKKKKTTAPRKSSAKRATTAPKE